MLFDLAINKLKDLTDPKKTGKVRVTLTKFLDEFFLKRLAAFIRHAKTGGSDASSKPQIPSLAQPTAATRKWPSSDKDEIIRVQKEILRKAEEERRMREEEERRQHMELQNMQDEDVPAMDE